MRTGASSTIPAAILVPLAVLAAALAGSGAARAADSTEGDATVPPVVASALLSDRPGDLARALATASKGEVPDDRTQATAPLRWLSRAEWSGGKYQWSASRGTLDIGMRFDAPSGAASPFDFRTQASGAVAFPLPAISLGLRHVLPGPPVAASNLLARATGATRPDAYVSKVGVEWKPAESNVNFLREGLGFRLDGNDRMTVRLRKGVLGIYMHRKF